jgi:hypothetical protein
MRLGVAVILASIVISLVLPAGVARAAVIEVKPARAENIPDETATKATALKGVKKVERYLLIKAQPHEVIGVEPEAPLRVITPEGSVIGAKLESGKTFRKEDDGKNVAIVGNNVYAEDYGYRGTMGAMATMKHLLEVGQTFKLTGEAGPRFRVLGTFSARPETAAQRVFVPLATAQKLYDRSGKFSHLFLTTEGDSEALAKELRAALGSEVQVRVISR